MSSWLYKINFSSVNFNLAHPIFSYQVHAALSYMYKKGTYLQWRLIYLYHTYHIRNVCWFHLVQVGVVEVGPGEVETPGSVSIMEEVTKVSSSVVLLLAPTQLTQGNHPSISKHILKEKSPYSKHSICLNLQLNFTYIVSYIKALECWFLMILESKLSLVPRPLLPFFCV